MTNGAPDPGTHGAATASDPQPDLSVLIVSHGHADLVRACLDSLPAALAGLAHEVIVTDNLAEPDFLARIGGPRPWLRLQVNAARKGFGANMNQAAGLARGRILLILNPDTHHHAGQVADAIAWLEAEPTRGVVAARLLNPDLTDQRNFRQFPSAAIAVLRGFGADRWARRPAFYRASLLEDMVLDGPARVDWVYGSFMLIRRATFLAFGGFDEGFFMYYEDVDLCHRLRRAGLTTAVFPGLTFVHHHLRTSAQERHGSHRKYHMRSLWRYLCKTQSFLGKPRTAPLGPAAAAAPVPRGWPLPAAFAGVIALAVLLAAGVACALLPLVTDLRAPNAVQPKALMLAVQLGGLILLAQFMLQEFDPVRLGDTPRRVVGVVESGILALFPMALLVCAPGAPHHPGGMTLLALLAGATLVLTALGTWAFSRCIPSTGARVAVVVPPGGQALSAGVPELPIGQQSVVRVLALDPGHTAAALADAIRAERLDHILLMLPPERDAHAVALLRDTAMFDVPVWHAAMPGPGARVLLLRAPLRSRAREAMKRGLDLTLGLAALALLAVPMLLVAAAIRIEDGGPVFFSQPRVGRNQVPFRMLKFRSMTAAQGDERGDRLTTRNDARITRVGAFIRKTSLDELPQLLNVIRGDMSIVGPRPLPVGFHYKGLAFDSFVPDWHHRTRVRPGITGLSQLRGLRGTPDSREQAERMMTDRVLYDNLYIDRWTIWLDLRILVMTVLSGAFMSGAY